MKKRLLDKVNLYNILLMVLTSLHHIYGAIIYNTPWRLHVLAVSIPVVLVTLGLSYFLKRSSGNSALLFWSYVLVVLIPSIGLIGFFEGVYNHLFKNILFWGGAEVQTLLQLFPPPTYVLPDDFFFELTGVLQALVVVLLTFYFVKLISFYFRSNKTN